MPKQKRFYPKKEKLKAQLPLIIAGKKTKTQAMLDAGYAESSANEQSTTFGYIGNDMQKALREHGFDEQKIAKKVMEGMEAEKRVTTSIRITHEPDYDVQHKFLTTGAKLLDVFPEEKLKIDLPQISDEELTRRIESAAKALAEERTGGTLGGESAEEKGISRVFNHPAQDPAGDDALAATHTVTPGGESLWQDGVGSAGDIAVRP